VRVLLDEHLPVDLAPELHGHEVDTVVGRGWALPFAVVLVRAASNRMLHLRPLVPTILDAIAASRPGQLQRLGA